jgi:DNA polymerase-3 subunit alpha
VIDVAKGLEGLRRQDGIHAAAVVITKEPLTTYLPIQRKPAAGQTIEDAPVVTQYEMGGVEALGLLKMDFLGLRNLDVISDTLEIIQRPEGVELDIDRVPLDDAQHPVRPAGRGDTIGVFQLEGRPCARCMRSLAPSSFEDVAAVWPCTGRARCRSTCTTTTPTARTAGSRWTYFHPDAEEVLGDTYGLMIYQESVMRVAQKFAGYSLAEADNLRKACGKKSSRADGQGAGQLRGGVRASPATAARWAPTCSTSSPSSPTTPSTRATASATAWSPTRPPT